MEPLSIMGAIFKVAQEIAKAASTARRNRRRCLELAERVHTVGDLLRDSKAAKDTATRKRVLGRLRDTLDNALELVDSCRRGGLLSRLLAAGRDAGRFDDVERRISNCLTDLGIANDARLERQVNQLAARGNHPAGTNAKAGSEEINRNAKKKDVAMSGNKSSAADGVMNLDLALVLEEKPTAIAEESTDNDRSLYDSWGQSNRLGLNLMRLIIAENVKPSMPKMDDAKEFMMKLKEYSQSDIADKSIVGSLMSELMTKKFDWSQPIHDHVTGMANIAAKLTSMSMDVCDHFLVQFIMNSLPPEFGQFQVNYNTIQEKWDLQEVKAMLVQEEGRLKKIRDHSVHLMVHNDASSSKRNLGKKGKKGKPPLQVSEGHIRKKLRCHFCKKVGHFKKDCPKRKKWFENKGIHYVKLRCHFCKKVGHFKKDCPKRKKWLENKGISFDPTHKPV